MISCVVLLAAQLFPAAASDEIAEHAVRGMDIGLVQIIRSGGAMLPVMLALSVAALALAVYLAIECRPGRVFRAAQHPGVLSRLASEDGRLLLEELKKDSTLYAGAARAALESGESAAAVAYVDRCAAILQGRVGWLARLGAISALVGLFGTTLGMLQVFAAGAREEFRPVLMYAAAMKAGLSGLFGVGIAVFALMAYFVIGSRLERALIEVRYAAGDIARLLERKARR